MSSLKNNKNKLIYSLLAGVIWFKASWLGSHYITLESEFNSNTSVKGHRLVITTMESYCVFVHMRCLEVNELLQKTVYFYLHHQFQTNREKEIDTQFQTTTKYILIPASDRNIYSRVFFIF